MQAKVKQAPIPHGIEVEKSEADRTRSFLQRLSHYFTMKHYQLSWHCFIVNNSEETNTNTKHQQ